MTLTFNDYLRARERMPEVDKLVDKLKPLIAGHDNSIQGAALAELMSLWLLGHRPDLRDMALHNWLLLTAAIMPINEQRYGPEGLPEKLH